MPRAQVVTHWSLPPQHAGYWTRLGGGDGWPERGGAGPMAGPHIPGLIPGWHLHGGLVPGSPSGAQVTGRPERTGAAARAPRGGMMTFFGRRDRRPGGGEPPAGRLDRRQPSRPSSRYNAVRPAGFR